MALQRRVNIEYAYGMKKACLECFEAVGSADPSAGILDKVSDSLFVRMKIYSTRNGGKQLRNEVFCVFRDGRRVENVL